MNICKNIFVISIISATITSWLASQPKSIKFDQIGLKQELSKSIVLANVQDAHSFICLRWSEKDMMAIRLLFMVEKKD